MSREVWKADFQIQVWQKIQTLNPENPGIALEPASESLFSQSNSLLSKKRVLCEKWP